MLAGTSREWPMTSYSVGFVGRWRQRRRQTVVAAAAVLAASGLATAAHALDNEDCLGCHSDKHLSKTDAASHTVSLTVDPERFGGSIHAKNLCTSCHTDVTDLEHPKDFHAKPVDCGQCHRVETDVYLNSDHGQAVHQSGMQAASCK